MKIKNKKFKKLIISVLLCVIFCFSPVLAAADADIIIHQWLDEIIDLYTERSLYGATRDEAVTEMLAKLLQDRPEMLGYLGDALLTARDDYGGYYSSETINAIFYSDSFYGYGIRIDGRAAANGHKYNTAIKQVFGGSPAEQAGLEAGDEIIKIGETDASALGMQAVSHKLAASDQTELTVKRNGEYITVSLSKSVVTVPPIDLKIYEEENTALIQIEHFRDMGLFYDLYLILGYLEQTEIGNLIIDLRGNPGGATDVMLECLNLLAPDEGAVLCSAVFKNGDPVVIKSTGIGFEFDNICVLVNGRSASASEIFALSLSEITGAVIIGEKTTGKGVGQEVHELENGYTALITSFEIVSSEGTRYNQKGVEPDIKILPEYIKTEHADFETLNFVNCRSIKKGAENKAALALNQRLAAIGYLDPEDITDICGENTVAAVEIFQNYNGLPAGIDKIDYLFIERLNLFVAALKQSRYESRDTQLECAKIYITRGEGAAEEFAAELELGEADDKADDD